VQDCLEPQDSLDYREILDNQDFLVIQEPLVSRDGLVSEVSWASQETLVQGVRETAGILVYFYVNIGALDIYVCYFRFIF